MKGIFLSLHLPSVQTFSSEFYSQAPTVRFCSHIKQVNLEQALVFHDVMLYGVKDRSAGNYSLCNFHTSTPLLYQICTAVRTFNLTGKTMDLNKSGSEFSET